jgi:hypothetical protein
MDTARNSLQLVIFLIAIRSAMMFEIFKKFLIVRNVRQFVNCVYNYMQLTSCLTIV